MCLQTRIIKEYRSNYPKDTLREISQRTGIQLTRVFRLLNGSPMKLSEYESFFEIVEHKSINDEGANIIKLIRNHGQKLNPRDMRRVIDLIQRKIAFSELTTSDVSTHTHNLELA